MRSIAYGDFLVAPAQRLIHVISGIAVFTTTPCFHCSDVVLLPLPDPPQLNAFALLAPPWPKGEFLHADRGAHIPHREQRMMPDKQLRTLDTDRFSFASDFERDSTAGNGGIPTTYSVARTACGSTPRRQQSV